MFDIYFMYPKEGFGYILDTFEDEEKGFLFLFLNVFWPLKMDMIDS